MTTTAVDPRPTCAESCVSLTTRQRRAIPLLIAAPTVEAGCAAANGTQLLGYQECQLLESGCSLVRF